MRIVLVGAASSIHLVRWANGLSSRGCDVWILTQHNLTHDLDENVKLKMFKPMGGLGYFLMVPWLRKQLSEIKPDIVNVHYASGYGTTAMLAKLKTYCLSVYGSDVYDFPERSFFHRSLLRMNLRTATSILSTSEAMAAKTEQLFSHASVFITPFGVDENLFQPSEKPDEVKSKFIFGTVKTLEKKYGIDTLIRGFAAAWRQLGCPDDMFLEIYGSGVCLDALRALAVKLGIEGRTSFGGFVHYANVPAVLNRMDVFCALSRLESFGVAIVEANSCEKPVIVSDADGPKEVTDDGVNGLIVPKEDWESSAKAMILLYQDVALREKMGKAGRKKVIETYSWGVSIDAMLNAYQALIRKIGDTI